MYNQILVPVDLDHVEALDKALATAAYMANCFEAPVIYVSVTVSQPSSVAHNPHEFAEKLRVFAQSQAEKYRIHATSSSLISHDPAVDLDQTLIKAIEETGADLVVMGSHQPGLADHFFASNAGYVASHAKVSVMVVR